MTSPCFVVNFPNSPPRQIRVVRKQKKIEKTQGKPKKYFFSQLRLFIKLSDESWYELLFGRTSDATCQQFGQPDADLTPGVAGHKQQASEHPEPAIAGFNANTKRSGSSIVTIELVGIESIEIQSAVAGLRGDEQRHSVSCAASDTLLFQLLNFNFILAQHTLDLDRRPKDLSEPSFTLGFWSASVCLRLSDNKAADSKAPPMTWRNAYDESGISIKQHVYLWTSDSTW